MKYYALRGNSFVIDHFVGLDKMVAGFALRRFDCRRD